MFPSLSSILRVRQLQPEMLSAGRKALCAGTNWLWWRQYSLIRPVAGIVKIQVSIVGMKCFFPPPQSTTSLLPYRTECQILCYSACFRNWGVYKHWNLLQFGSFWIVFPTDWSQFESVWYMVVALQLQGQNRACMDIPPNATKKFNWFPGPSKRKFHISTGEFCGSMHS